MSKHWILKNKKLTESIKQEPTKPKGKVVTGKERDKILAILDKQMGKQNG